MKTALLILRTPFQAWLSEKIIKREEIIEYDLLYFTQNDSKEDRLYFSKLEKKAKISHYIFMPMQRLDILNHIGLLWLARHIFKDFDRQLVLFSSINSFILNSIMRHQNNSELITLDDGSANINMTSGYHQLLDRKRIRFYQWLFGAEHISKTKNRINRHYTLHPEHKNIVCSEKLRTIFSWNKKIKHNGRKTYFIGQPMSPRRTPQEISKLQEYLRSLSLDVYVRHPREISPLNLGIPILDKKGYIAEEAILADAVDREIHLVACFSSVLLNMASISKTHMILFANDELIKIQEYGRLAKIFRCKVAYI